jgi:sugar/nucleoside kinase (ribokinase family)
MDNNTAPALTIIGDVGVDVVLGPIDRWPAVGTETLMDHSELRPGGSAGNAALAASYLGASCRLLSLVGNDSLGVWLAEQFQWANPALPVCDLATSVSVGIIHSCGERTFLTTRGHLEAFDYQHVRPFLQRAKHRPAIVLLSGVFLTPKLRAGYASLIEEIAALGHEVALDTGWPSGNWNGELREEMFGWVERCDHVLLNEIEVANLADRVGDDDLRVAIDSVSRRLKPGASLVVKTGSKGAIGYQSGTTVRVAAVAAAVFDTIGAGDSFNAGYLLARLDGGDLTSAIEAGCRAAASIITRHPRRAIKPGELAGHFELPRRLVAR